MQLVERDNVVAQYLPERGDDYATQTCAVQEGADPALDTGCAGPGAGGHDCMFILVYHLYSWRIRRGDVQPKKRVKTSFSNHSLNGVTCDGAIQFGPLPDGRIRRVAVASGCVAQA